jgi:hypothetical protein
MLPTLTDRGSSSIYRSRNPCTIPYLLPHRTVPRSLVSVLANEPYTTPRRTASGHHRLFKASPIRNQHCATPLSSSQSTKATEKSYFLSFFFLQPEHTRAPPGSRPQPRQGCNPSPPLTSVFSVSATSPQFEHSLFP